MLTQEIQQLLEEGQPKTIPGVTDDLYQLPPFIPKACSLLTKRNIFWSKARLNMKMKALECEVCVLQSFDRFAGMILNHYLELWKILEPSLKTLTWNLGTS